jgi:SAM-dependent methyltransferase
MPDRAAHDPLRRLIGESLGAGDPTGWFERLYEAAESGEAAIPWDRGAPQALLVEWTRRRELAGDGRSALVVGCGLGDDAEHVGSLGFETVAFDVAAGAIRAARRRFPDSPVAYCTADLLDPPAEWEGRFDLVVECITVQSLPDPPRREAIRRIASFLAPGGTLIVVAAAREAAEPADGPPWPLTRDEVEAFAGGGVELVSVEDLLSGGDRRWRAELRRP